MSGNPNQTYADIVTSRRSIRGYLDKPVPRDLIEEILTLAMRSPTSMNTQPWHFHVITGEPLDRIRKGNTERILAGEPDSRELAERGGLQTQASQPFYDLIIVGAGPAGLAAAVAGSSGGMRTADRPARAHASRTTSASHAD